MGVAVLCAVMGAPGDALAEPDEVTARTADHFQQAEAFMKAGTYDLAITEYQAAYALLPKPGFLFNIGLAYEAAGDDQNALENYRAYLEQEPAGRASKESRARIAALERKIAAAAEAHAEKEAKAKESAAHVASARGHAEAGRHQEAISSYRAAYDLTGAAEMLFEIGAVLRAAGDSIGAIAEFERYRKEASGDARRVAALRHITELEQARVAASVEPAGAGVAGGSPAEIGAPRPPTRVAFILAGGGTFRLYPTSAFHDIPGVSMKQQLGVAMSIALDARLTGRVGVRGRVCSSITQTDFEGNLEDGTPVATVEVFETGLELLVTASPLRRFAAGRADLLLYAGPGYSMVAGNTTKVGEEDGDMSVNVPSFVVGIAMEIGAAGGRIIVDASYTIYQRVTPNDQIGSIRMQMGSLLVGYAFSR